MRLTPQALAREAAATGFGSEPLEKVFRLMALLDALASHPFLKNRIALKGGTALNLFYFAWTRTLLSECRERLSLVLPLDDAETELLRRLDDEGTIDPSLVTADPTMQAALRRHPGLEWKALNVRRHRGLEVGSEPDAPS